MLEVRPAPSLAAGPAGEGLGVLLRRLVPETRIHLVDEPMRNPAFSHSRGGTWVVVLRDAHRHEWQRSVAESLPDAIVVETGLPLWRPSRCRAYVATYGAGRVNLEAAAELLASRSISSSSGS